MKKEGILPAFPELPQNLDHTHRVTLEETDIHLKVPTLLMDNLSELLSPFGYDIDLDTNPIRTCLSDGHRFMTVHIGSLPPNSGVEKKCIQIAGATKDEPITDRPDSIYGYVFCHNPGEQLYTTNIIEAESSGVRVRVQQNHAVYSTASEGKLAGLATSPQDMFRKVVRMKEDYQEIDILLHVLGVGYEDKLVENYLGMYAGGVPLFEGDRITVKYANGEMILSRAEVFMRQKALYTEFLFRDPQKLVAYLAGNRPDEKRKLPGCWPSWLPKIK